MEMPKRGMRKTTSRKIAVKQLGSEQLYDEMMKLCPCCGDDLCITKAAGTFCYNCNYIKGE